MVQLFKVTAEINGVKQDREMVAKPNPSYAQYENRVNKAFDLGKKDTIKNVKFEVIKNNLGLGYE